ncbi:Chaperone protein DnaJ [Sesamum angolense]|uniref:Chaperone protein DnaJ n=1 Tax=Sesamum angolense TaxID=2727404 RepID=A0AAE1T9T5_9LAMI|nr:Chaperone protein DnaJ [Sesamum angolense]
MLTTVDVYVSAENKISGEIDWYGVLGVSPSSDDETIRKQYRKLALMLHPDKNKSVGSDGAFKLISEAWSLLSDKAKRLAYNQRRGSKGFQQKVQVQTGGPSAPSRPNGVFNFASRTASAPKTQNTSGKAPPTPAPTPSHQRTDTFWTICHRCKMHYVS